MKRTSGLILCLAFVFSAALPALAQEGYGQKLNKFPESAFEREDDLPVRDTGWKVKLYSTPSQVNRGKYHSYQVNVDSNGQNVIGDAANEPSLAVDPNDRSRMAIGWRQFDSISSNFREAGNAYTTDGGFTWHNNQVIQDNVFRSDPVLAVNSEGVMKYCSLTSVTAMDMWTSIGGESWTGPISAYGGDKQWIAIDRTLGGSQGNIYAAWSAYYGCCGEGVFTRSFDGGTTWEEPSPLPNSPLFGTVTVGPYGEVYVAGTFAYMTGIGFCRSNSVKDPSKAPAWQIMGSVPLGADIVYGGAVNPDGLDGQVWVDCDRSHTQYRGNVYVLATVGPFGSDPCDVMFCRSNDGGKTWSKRVRVNNDSRSLNSWNWFGTMSVAPNGRIDVVWNDTRYDATPSNPSTSVLFYTYSNDAGRTWAPGVPITPAWQNNVGYPNQSKIGDYYHMISDDQGASLAYAATFNGEQDVWYLRIPNSTGPFTTGG